MYIEIDEGYWEHPKTLDLCARLQDERADTYPPRLWKWAVRSAKTGKLGKITAWAIEKAVRYTPMDGKCAEALIGSGFIERAEDGEAEIHDWMDYTGAAIKKMDKKAKENRQRRAEAKAKHEEEKKQHRTATVPARGDGEAGTIPSRPDQTRQDQSSQDKTSKGEEEKACAEPAVAATALVSFPCSGSPEVWDMTEANRSEWETAYPAVDVLGEARKALAWINANPTKRKTARGMARFLVSWMSRCQDHGGSSPTVPSAWIRDPARGHFAATSDEPTRTGELQVP